jgi:hypothetical protein
VNAPQTVEGRDVWDLALRCENQLRAIPGAVLGLDLGAALALARALAIDLAAVADLLPRVEAGMIHALNERLRSDG